MTRIFGRHHVRANFYHFVSLIFVLTFALWSFDIISDKMSTIIGMILFITDYVAEMYDPHPETPGPWFRSHFHRFFDGGVEDEKVECTLDRLYNKYYNTSEFDHLYEKLNDDGSCPNTTI